jgi:MipA family protein
MLRGLCIIAFISSGLLGSSVAAAQGSCKTPSPDCVAVGEFDLSVSLGLGERSNPIQSNSDIPLLVVPQFSYYGKRFFVENLEVGFTLLETESHTLSMIAAPGYDRVFFYRNDLQNVFIAGAVSPGVGLGSVPTGPTPADMQFAIGPRRTTVLAGPEWTWSHGELVGQLDALYEVTGRHDGYEVRAALARPIVKAKGSLLLSIGATFKSAALVRYYYGVEGVYEPGSAFNPFIKLGYSVPLSERWTFNAFAHYEYLHKAVADSPIVADHSVTTAFAGFVFKIL